MSATYVNAYQNYYSKETYLDAGDVAPYDDDREGTQDSPPFASHPIYSTIEATLADTMRLFASLLFSSKSSPFLVIATGGGLLLKAAFCGPCEETKIGHSLQGNTREIIITLMHRGQTER
jgi:hypothetical protein